jgi:signal transduction histidine kinase
MKELSERLVTLQEDERQRITEELHDSTAQHLVAANLNLMKLRSNAGSGSDDEGLWDDVEACMEATFKELRTFSYVMHPLALHADGLRSTLRQYLDAYGDRAGLSVKLRSSLMVDTLPLQMQRSLFRITQEALANVQRHASASRVSVDLRWINGRLHLAVTDDGHGVNGSSEGSRLRNGLGISGIKARAHQFGGEFRMRSGPLGTTIHVATPVDNAHTLKT